MINRAGNEFSGVDLVGTVSTFYTDPHDIRFELALQNAENWRDQNLPYVVVDASPMEDENDTWVKDAHEERGAIVVRANTPGIATQRQQGVAHAFSLGAEKVVGHEPEKILMSQFASEISAGLNVHQILVIGRTAAARASLPPIQAWTEDMAGWILEQTHNFPPDALSGGRGFTAEGAKVLAQYPGTQEGFNNWIYLYRTPLEAREAGLSVGSLTVDLLHPATMTAMENGDAGFDRKRYNQFKLQLDYLMARSDVDPLARPIADAVQHALLGINAGDSNETFHEQLRRLEERLVAFGYRS